MFYLEDKYPTEKQQLLLIFYQQFLILVIQLYYEFEVDFIFLINNATLNRFFSLHFILLLVILFIVILHLFALHLTGSSNPLGSNFNNYKISFHPYFSIKDLLGFYIFN